MKLSTQVALLALVAGVGCKKGPDGAAPLASKEVQRVIHPVFFSTGPKGPQGGIGEAKVIVKPNPGHEVRVASYEEFSGGAGNQWRAAVWMASFLASSTLGRTLTDYEFGVSAGGLIDGPSAGALTTAGIMAAILDVDVKQDVTMTGTINPDGTVGPVGGIPHKMEGAAAKGKKVFGYPIGQRYSMDLSTNRLVDVQQVGQQNNIEAREIKDLHEAYTLLTGKTLERPVPLDAPAMELPPKLFQRMQAKTDAWLAKATANTQRMKQNKTAAGQWLKGVEDSANEVVERTRRYQRQGMVPVAYMKAQEAVATTDMALRLDKIIQFMMKKDLDAILLELDAMEAVEAEWNAFMAKLATEEPATAGAAVALIGAYMNALDAYAAIQVAKQNSAEFRAIMADLKAGKVRWDAATLGQNIVMRLILPCLFFAYGGVVLESATDVYDANEATGDKLVLDADAVQLLAKGYTSAAKANVDYYDALITEAQAKEAGASVERLKSAKANQDPQYLFVQNKLNYAIDQRSKKGLAAALSVLGASVGAYLGAASLVTKEYSLGVKLGPDGNPKEVSNDKAFMAMLESGELKARESAGLSKGKTHAVPPTVALTYQAAKALREGDTKEKLDGLELFWMSSAYSQLTVLLTHATR